MSNSKKKKIFFKKKLNEKGKKMLNAKLEHHLGKSYALLHKISTFIYIYIYMYIDDYSFITANH